MTFFITEYNFMIAENTRMTQKW